MIYFLIPFLVTIDLVTKQLASLFLEKTIFLFGDIFYLHFARNPGIAFSIEVPLLLLKIITIVLIIFIFYYYIKEEKIKNSKLVDISFGLILAGAIGNGVERVLFSSVRDFMGIQNFAIFNLADSFITIGAILYIYSLYKLKK